MLSFKKKIFIRVFLSSFVLIFTQIYAGNISVFGVATRAESMEGAFTAVADDPSAVYYNPAGLTQIQQTEIDSGADLILPDITYTNRINGATSTNFHSVLAPNLYLSTNHWQPIYFGFGVYAPFARSSDYDPNLAVYNFTHYSRFTRIDFAPTIAVAVNQYISLGAGLVGSRVDAVSNIFGFDQSGDGYGATGQAGILVKFPEHINAGIVYHGAETTRINGTGKFLGFEDSFNADIKLPATMSVGLSWQALSTLLLSVTYDYEMWSTMKEVKSNFSNPIFNQVSTIPVDGQNSDNIRFGVIFRPEGHDEFRAGYAYITAAVPAKNVVPAIPDYTGNLYSLGYSRYFSKLRLDAGYEFADIVSLNSNNMFFPGRHTGHVNVIMVGLGYALC